MNEYIAEQYAKQIAEASIEDAAQDQAYESVFRMAEDDDLGLTVQQTSELAEEVRNIMNSRIVIKIN